MVLLLGVPPSALTKSFTASENDWIDAEKGDASIQNAASNPVLVPTDLGEWIIGDPSMLDLPNGDRYVFANEIFHGIIWYKMDKSDPSKEMTFQRQPKSVVGYPGAVRPFAHYEPSTGNVHLFYEQYRLTSLYRASDIWMKTGILSSDGATIAWEKSDIKILSPTLDWEKIGTERVGNPYVFWSSAKEKYVLYYSASSVHLPDSGVDEPIYLGMAISDKVRG